MTSSENGSICCYGKCFSYCCHIGVFCLSFARGQDSHGWNLQRKGHNFPEPNFLTPAALQLFRRQKHDPWKQSTAEYTVSLVISVLGKIYIHMRAGVRLVSSHLSSHEKAVDFLPITCAFLSKIYARNMMLGNTFSVCRVRYTKYCQNHVIVIVMNKRLSVSMPVSFFSSH